MGRRLLKVKRAGREKLGENTRGRGHMKVRVPRLWRDRWGRWWRWREAVSQSQVTEDPEAAVESSLF